MEFIKLNTTSRTLTEEVEFSTFENLIFYGFFIFLATLAYEGGVRYLFSKIGLESIIYSRELIEVFSILLVFFRALFKRNIIHSPISIAFSILSFHFLVTLLFGATLFQALLGLKIFMPIIYGIAIWPIIQRKFYLFSRIMFFVFLTSCIGVIVNKLLGKMPWEGEVYNTVFGSVQGTKVWSAFGESRLPGFSRSSITAAMVIGVSSISLNIILKSALLRILMTAFGFVAIYFTTTKGMIQGYATLFLIVLFTSEFYFYKVSKFTILLLASLSVLLPTIIVFFDLGFLLKKDDIPVVLLSFWERLTWMWPDGFGLVKHWYNFILGAGLGSIGVPAQYYLPINYGAAADNIFVYLFANFGALGVFYIAYLVSKSLLLEKSPQSYWILSALILLFSHGLTTNVVENQFFSAILGLCYGYLFNNKYKLG